MVNLRSGGRTRVAGATASVLVLIIVLVAYPIINLIPMAGLVGVMVVIAFETFDW
jgi:sulfate permease, SulP family